MTQNERETAFKTKLTEFAVLAKELHELAKDSRTGLEMPYIWQKFGTDGDLLNEIKDLCKHYSVDF